MWRALAAQARAQSRGSRAANVQRSTQNGALASCARHWQQQQQRHRHCADKAGSAKPLPSNGPAANGTNNSNSKLLTLYHRVCGRDRRAPLLPRSLTFFLINAAFVTNAIASLQTDILHLRTLSMASGIGGMMYNMTNFEKPQWVLLCWSLLFFTINGVQVHRILVERQDVLLDVNEQLLYHLVFEHSGMRPKQMKNVLAVGKWRQLEPGEVIFKEGQEHNKFYVIANGSVDAYRNAARVLVCRQGDFLNTGLFRNRTMDSIKAGRDVRDNRRAAWFTTRAAEMGARVMEWDRDTLFEYLSNSKTTLSAFMLCLADDLITKLEREATGLSTIGALAQQRLVDHQAAKNAAASATTHPNPNPKSPFSWPTSSKPPPTQQPNNKTDYQEEEEELMETLRRNLEAAAAAVHKLAATTGDVDEETHAALIRAARKMGSGEGTTTTTSMDMAHASP